MGPWWQWQRLHTTVGGSFSLPWHTPCFTRENHIPQSSLGQKYLCIQLSESMHHPRSRRRTRSKGISLDTKENLANYHTPPPPGLHPPREAGLHRTGIIFSTSKWNNMQIIIISRMLFYFPSQDTSASSTKEMVLVFVWILTQCCVSLGSLNLNTYLGTAMFMPTDMEGSGFSCPFLSALSD